MAGFLVRDMSNHLKRMMNRRCPLLLPSVLLLSSAVPEFAASVTRRSVSSYAPPNNEEDNELLDFPGGKVPFTATLNFLQGIKEERVPCFRVLNEDGKLINHTHNDDLSEDLAVKIYRHMVTLQIMDSIFYDAQRQGRISFFVTTMGEEAINIASAAALESDDIVVPQYREAGVLLWRGFTLQDFANQCFSNKGDSCKGRQMPVHYGSSTHNYFTVASTIASQTPHAVGVGYSLKMDKKNACAVTFFGDGGSSEGDFHGALNFAAVLEVPVVFICRNNGFAISTPLSDQFRSDGVVAKGAAYGVRSIRVDGNDALAVYIAVREAREMAVKEGIPILIEALTYRSGHHSTSDDSTKYRSADEIERWKSARHPIRRFRKYIESNGWWSHEMEVHLRNDVRDNKVISAIEQAEEEEKPRVAELFTDVYDVLPSNLLEQEHSLRDVVSKFPHLYPSHIPL